jgi:hypothetical protein
MVQVFPAASRTCNLGPIARAAGRRFCASMALKGVK